LRIISEIESIEGLTADQKTGVAIIAKALRASVETILENAGERVEVIINEIERGPSFDYGYNAKTRKFENFLETGIIDPTKVARLCLENAASVAGMLLTSKTLIHNDLTGHKEEQIRPDGRSFDELI
jgi:chaperonin GroEL